jgi:hypothetical protein
MKRRARARRDCSRLGTALIVVVAVCAADTASTAPMHPHYTINAGLQLIEPLPAVSGMQIKSQMAAATSSTPQAGGGFALSAHLAASQLACAGDLIFADGFESSAPP